MELKGLILGWLVLEPIMPDQKHCHIGIFCDNTPTVVWTNRLASKRSLTSERPLRTL